MRALHVRPAQSYLFVVPWPVKPGGGVNNAVLGLRACAARDFEVSIAISGWDDPPSGQQGLRLPSWGRRWTDRVGYVAKFFPNLWRLQRLTRDKAVINAHFVKGPEILPFAVLRRLGLVKKFVISVHGSDVADALQLTGIERSLFRFVGHSADVVVGCSQQLCQQFKAVCPGARTVAVYNGVLLPPETALESQRPMEERYIVSVAAFRQVKGNDVTIEAFSLLRKTNPELHLVLIGNAGPELPKLKERARDLGIESKIRWLVDLPHADVWQWLRYAECFVLASRREGFGLALLEAALMETPVVATDVPGINELVHDLRNGLLCPADDGEALAAAIAKSLGDSATAQDRAERFLAMAREFTWQKAWESYKQHLKLT